MVWAGDVGPYATDNNVPGGPELGKVLSLASYGICVNGARVCASSLGTLGYGWEYT